MTIFARKRNLALEDWEFEFEWLKVRHYIKDQFGKSALPDLNAILFLIGIQELGQVKNTWTKEEKQDLMHIATCQLLSLRGYYTLEGLDHDGWPHYKLAKRIPAFSLEDQEKMLKELIIQYFNENFSEEE